MHSVKSKWKQTWGGGTINVTLCSLCEKIAWFFKQQIEFFLISYLAVAKFSLLKEHRHFFKLFIWLVNILLLSLKKDSSFLSFHYPVFISIPQLFLRGGGVTHKSKHMLRREEGYMKNEKGWTLEVSSERTFWMISKCFCSN